MNAQGTFNTVYCRYPGEPQDAIESAIGYLANVNGGEVGDTGYCFAANERDLTLDFDENLSAYEREQISRELIAAGCSDVEYGWKDDEVAA